MSHCWKCGKELAGSDAECEGDCNAADLKTGLHPPDKDFDWVDIDWSRVKTTADIIAILSSLNLKVSVGSATHAKLKPYLKL